MRKKIKRMKVKWENEKKGGKNACADLKKRGRI